MTIELYCLLLATLMTACFWIPYTLNRFAMVGFWQTLAGTLPVDLVASHSLWAQRAIHAHRNAIENLAIFAPAVLAASVLHISTPVTMTAAITYVAARFLHFIAYTLGVPVARTVLFLIGWCAQMALLVSLLGAM